MGFWKDLFGLSSKSAAECYKRGSARRQDGDWEEALAAFTEAIRLDPQHRGAYHDRAVIYIQTGNYEQAIAELTTAARLHPDFAPIYFNRGFAHSKRGDHRTAIGDYTQAITLDPHYAAPLAARSQAAMTVDDYPQALDDLDKLFTLVIAGTVRGPSPVRSPGDILLQKAELFVRIADYDRAITELSGALRYDVKHWIVFARLGLACAKKGDLEGSLRGYRDAATRQPPDWYCNKLRGLERAVVQPLEHAMAQELIAFGTWTREFDSINYGNTIEVTEILREPPTRSRQKRLRADIMARILRTPGEFIPVVLYRLAFALFAESKKEESVFWLNAGRLRTWYDACRCADMVARITTLRDMEIQVPDALRHVEHEDRQLHARVIQEVLDWDEKTPYLHDHRWIYQHSSGAYIAFLGPEEAEAAGLQEARDPDAGPGALSLP